MIQPGEARKLCSKSEWVLLESSFSPSVEALSASDLKSRINRVRKLHQDSEDLVHLQHSDDRKRTTRRKIELFAEAVGRLESTLSHLEKVAPVLKSVDSERLTEETRTLNTGALQVSADLELERRKKHVQSAFAARGEQQGDKSGARRIQSRVLPANHRQQGRRDNKNK
jgi:hypothetical protein